MNKVILTHDRVFMSILGPSGCGETTLISNAKRFELLSTL